MKIAEKLINKLRENNLKLITVESCTGGIIGKKLTDIPGASDVYEGGLITYSNELKMALCDVKEETLSTFGAVSKGVALEMAEGALKKYGADITVSVTGVAGPGESENKPQGLVYIAVATNEISTAYRFNFKGDREDVRKQTAKEALKAVINTI